jgi:hypothetical protein
MKTMTCRQLGGACELEFHAETFEQIAEMSQQHGMQMFEKRDEAHLKAMEEMKTLMSDPNAMTEWFDARKKEFEALPSE